MSILQHQDVSPHPLIRGLNGLGIVACAFITLFIIWTTTAGRYPSQVQYATVLTLGLIATFALKPGPLSTSGQGLLQAVVDIILIVLSLACGVYFLTEYQDIAAYREGLPNTADLLCYVTGTLLILEAARRAEGWALLAIVGTALAYLLLGHYLPGILAHRRFYIDEVLEIAYSYQGIFGIALGAVVDVVLMFVILGAALRHTGAGDFFNYIALRLTRGRRSGAAQAAIIGSALFGSVNGSAPANVMSTGVLTIPMMKRAGYQARFAGAVEAVASCSGQLMPPIMGVGAFIMAQLTGIPYPDILLAALVPAFLYLLALSVAVALEAGRLGLSDNAQQTEAFDVRRKAQGLVLLVGFTTLIVLLFLGFSPTYCGLMAAGAVIVVAMAFRATRLKPRFLWACVVDGGRDGLKVLITCAAIGIVIGAVNVTGLGITLNQAIIALGQDNLLLALILAAFCSILLGMGLPTAASYLMVIFVAGPAIMKLGVGLLQAHLFVFYYAVLSAITPPVALAVFAAASIAQAGTLGIAMSALRLSIVAFLLPLAWIYHPEINLQTLSSDGWALPALDVGLLVIATVGISAANVGFFRRPMRAIERLILIPAGIAILLGGLWWSLAGAAISVGILLLVSYTAGPRRSGATRSNVSSGVSL